ncbi:MAG: hypothetical protein OJF49_000392 [Ktedonobacterales bacterium]|jgi:osmoprotectant transport system permease protein|nr:MAG: hypothetical protein OJF49_000392 [Ktedonobacterales bacterium]
MSYILDGYNWDLTDPGSIPNLLIAHISITFVSVLIGLAIAFPLAFLVARFKHLYLPTVTTAGILYTIPSLALFALLIPFTAFSQATVLIPLVIYTQVVLIRNIVAGIRAVDPQLVEVGRAMGMNSWQLQWRVVLPLAMPVIIAGIRVVTVTTIGIATLAPWVGTEDLGTLMYQGFNFARSDMEAAGTILVIALAVAADLLLLGVQAALSRGQRVNALSEA